MLLLILGLVLFLGTHAFSMARARRAQVIVRSARAATSSPTPCPPSSASCSSPTASTSIASPATSPVWDPPVWTRHLALLLTALAFVALASAYLPGHIRARAKHPMLLAVKIWATAHLLANGDLGSHPAVRRLPRLGGDGPDQRQAPGARAPGRWSRSMAAPAAAPAGWRNDALAVVIGLAVWFVVRPLPASAADRRRRLAGPGLSQRA